MEDVDRNVYTKSHNNLVSLKMTKSLMNPYRKLLVLGLNTLLQQNLLSLHWDKGKKDNGHHFCALAGEPSVISWNDAGFGEVRIAVWWKYDHSKHPQANASGDHKEQFLTSITFHKYIVI